MSPVRWPPPRAADRLGVAHRYQDTSGRWQKTSDLTRRAIHAAMCGSENGDTSTDCGGPLVVQQGGEAFVPGSRIRLEDGAGLGPLSELPTDTPLGYHQLETAKGNVQRLIVTPAKCYLPDDLSIWGWFAQLYAVRSNRSWGFGDLADLARLGRWSKELGASITCLNPLAAATPVSPLLASPYSPSSRCFRNPLYISLDDLPGSDTNVPEFASAKKAGLALNANLTIDRDAVFRIKMNALKAIWERFRGNPAFDVYVAEQGDLLKNFARFCALAEKHGRDWRTWPAEYRHPKSGTVEQFAQANESPVRFHAWLQWILDVQLAKAAAELPLMQDLPIGVEAGGADAWAWQELIATTMSVGAPPDMFNQAGQNWSLPPIVPDRLRAANYEPFIHTLRAALKHAGGLRIDHVMGLFRLFWIPADASPAAGAYVYYPVEDMLGILALESHRAKAFIVGEDLGTVDPQIRELLAARNVLSYRLVWFENGPPESFPWQSLAAFGTHDLPTIAGLWTGQDERDEITAGLPSNPEGWQAIREQLGKLTGLPLDAPHEEVNRLAYGRLAEAPSAVVTAALEDALAIEHRPNMPGTTDTWPNWSMALPKPLEEIETMPLPREIAKVFSARGGGRKMKPEKKKSRASSGRRSKAG